MPQFNIMDIFYTPKFQQLQDDIAASVGLALIATDYTGHPVTQHSQCTQFCHMVREHPYYKISCERCDSRGGLEAARTRAPYIYICHSKIVDFAIPIIYNNTYLGAIMAGQVLLNEENDLNQLEQIYTASNIPPLKSGEYHEAFLALPRMSLEKISSISKMLLSVCNMFLELEITHLSSPVSSNEPEVMPISRISKNILSPVYEYIEKNIFSNLSLSAVAAACNISANYLSRLFSKFNDMTFSNYVNQKKIEYAKKILLSTDMSVNEVASRLGFSDCSYFIKVFRKITGNSPSQYRQQTQKDK